MFKLVLDSLRRKKNKKMVIESDESDDDLDLKCCKYFYAYLIVLDDTK